MEAINPELNDLRQKYETLLEKYADLSASLSRTQGEVAEIKRVSTSYSLQTVWQLLGFAAVMAGVMMGGIYYQTNALRNEFNARFDAQHQQILQSEKNLQQQIQQVERNVSARFEDLKQEVRANRK
jgi:transcription initiation factor TFIID subunit TAF12